MLLDCGDKTKSYDYGERVIVPFLLNERSASLDYLFLSGKESSLTGGVQAVLEDVTVKDILALLGTSDFISTEALRHGSYQEVAGPLEILFPDGVKLSILLSRNEVAAPQHLAYLLEHRGARFLLAGALEELELTELLTLRPLQGMDLIEIKESLQGAAPLSSSRVLLLTGGGFSYPRRLQGSQRPKKIEISSSKAGSPPLVFKSRYCGAITVETDGENLIVGTFLSGGGR